VTVHPMVPGSARGFGNWHGPYKERREDDGVNRAARAATMAPRMPWDKFTSQVLRWNPGEHVALIGPTGQGKTTMLLAMLPLHHYVVIFGTKPRDDTMDKLIATGGYVRLDRWVPGLDADEYPKRIVWPDAREIKSVENQKLVFADAFARIYREGGWTVAIDELWYFGNDGPLHMNNEIKLYLQQSRSLGISLVAGTQRPAWVPREIYTQCTHIMFWRINDDEDIRSIAGIGSANGSVVRELVQDLEPFQVLYLNTRTGQMVRTRCPAPPKTPTTSGRKERHK
jgi:hypothetical protein